MNQGGPIFEAGETPHPIVVSESLPGCNSPPISTHRQARRRGGALPGAAGAGHLLLLRREEPGPGPGPDPAELAAQEGTAGTMTHDYKRHGTTTVFAALDIATERSSTSSSELTLSCCARSSTCDRSSPDLNAARFPSTVICSGLCNRAAASTANATSGADRRWITSSPGHDTRWILAITSSSHTKGVTRASRTCLRRRSISRNGPSGIARTN